jgi:hypothetical protein
VNLQLYLTNNTQLRAHGFAAPTGLFASSACVEGNSWPLCAGWRSSLMGLLLPDATTF